MKKTFAILLCLGMFCAIFAGCGGAKGGEAKEDVIYIGVFEPASGDNGAGGKQETLGIQYANSVQPTVEVGGKEYKVELKIVDNESSNDKAPSAAAELVNAGCSVVLGSYGSGVSMAGGPTFEAAGIPAIGVTCTNALVTDGNDYYFRVCFIDDFQAPVLANYASGNLSAKKAYCLNKLGDDYSGNLVNIFIDSFEKLGGSVVHEEFPEGNADFTAYVTKAKNEGCEVFFSPVSIEAAQLIIKAAEAQDLNIPLLAGDTWDSNMVLEAAKGTDVAVTVTTFYADGADPEFEKGIKEWINADSDRLAKNGGNDTLAAVSVMGYDAYFAALEGLKLAGSADPKAVNEALWNVEFDGVTGHITFNEKGDANIATAYVKGADNENAAWIGLGAVTIQ